MALQKDKTTLQGVTGNYWRIVQLSMNYDRLDAVCDVALYVDEATRLAGKTPLTTVKFNLAVAYHGQQTTGDDTMKNVSLKEAYRVLKTLAQTENSKPSEDENKNLDLAYFYGAIDV